MRSPPCLRGVPLSGLSTLLDAILAYLTYGLGVEPPSVAPASDVWVRIASECQQDPIFGFSSVPVFNQGTQPGNATPRRTALQEQRPIDLILPRPKLQQRTVYQLSVLVAQCMLTCTCVSLLPRPIKHPSLGHVPRSVPETTSPTPQPLPPARDCILGRRTRKIRGTNHDSPTRSRNYDPTRQLPSAALLVLQ